MRCKCEAVEDVNVDFEECGKRVHSFWQDPVDKSINYFGLSRPFADKVYVILHNCRGYNAQFHLRMFLELRLEPKFIMDGSKILSMVVEYLHFLISLNYLSMSLKRPNHLTLHAKRATTPSSKDQESELCGLLP